MEKKKNVVNEIFLFLHLYIYIYVANLKCNISNQVSFFQLLVYEEKIVR